MASELPDLEKSGCVHGRADDHTPQGEVDFKRHHVHLSPPVASEIARRSFSYETLSSRTDSDKSEQISVKSVAHKLAAWIYAQAAARQSINRICDRMFRAQRV